MSPKLTNGNVVITAEQFNPSIVSQIWLAKNGLVREEEFGEGCIFVGTVSQVRTRDFDLLVIPQRAQFEPHVEPDHRQQLICEKLGLLVQRLPETPYRALGFNLVWQLLPQESAIEAVSRRLFYVPEGPIHRFFDVADGRFGSYLSKDSLGFRLKLTALPISVETPTQERENAIALNFNFHFDLPEEGDPVKNILSMLARWDDAVAESSQIAQATQE